MKPDPRDPSNNEKNDDLNTFHHQETVRQDETALFTDEDKARIQPPEEPTDKTCRLDAEVTLRTPRPFRLRMTLVPRTIWITAITMISIPALLWGLAILLPRPPGDVSLAQWVVAASQPTDDAVVLRSSSSGPHAVLVVHRRGARMAAMDPHKGRSTPVWEFPRTANGTLIGDTLGDCALWVPQTGPFTPPPDGPPPTAAVFWMPDLATTSTVNLTLLNRDGSERWTRTLNPPATPDRFFWVVSPESSLLGFVNANGSPVRIDVDSGRRVSSGLPQENR